jgi:triosephosphate isomerase
MKRMLVAGNWKMNKDIAESVALVSEILSWLDGKDLKSKVLVCPPFTSIPAVQKLIENTSLLLGAQNCHYESKGAYTGEISPSMLKSAGCEYVIVGHSERRTYFFETDTLVNKKVIALLAHNLKPILCIGETLDERNDDLTFDVIERQIQLGLRDVDAEQIAQIVIAYEPVWAIGTGVTATIEQIGEAHRFIRNCLIKLFGGIANDMMILYGGSVNSQNCPEIFAIPEVNGALVGGASLVGKEFVSIIESSETIASST